MIKIINELIVININKKHIEIHVEIILKDQLLQNEKKKKKKKKKKRRIIFRKFIIFIINLLSAIINKKTSNFIFKNYCCTS